MSTQSKRPIAILMGILFTCTFGRPGMGQELELPDDSDVAERFVEAFFAGRFDDALTCCSAQLVEKTSVARMRLIQSSIQKSFGQLQRQDTPRATDAENALEVIVPLTFERGNLSARLRLAGDGTVAAYSFVPAKAAERWQPPSYADLDSFREIEIEIKADAHKPLPGAICVPRGPGPVPGVVLVHGAGPGNRDAGRGGNLPFRDLAYGLASRGLAVLRYDKRTVAEPERFQGVPYTVEDEVLADAVAALDHLRRTDGVDPDRIVLIGHSMGAMLAPRIAQRTAVAGLVLLAGPTRPLVEVIAAQMDYLADLDGSGVSQTQTESVRGALQRIAMLSAEDIGDPERLLGAPAAYWLDLRSYDPMTEIGELDLPVLAIWGDRDFQVSERDQDGWRSALGGRTDATFMTYAGLNHLFESGTGASSFKEYQKPAHVSSAVVADIASWIESRVLRSGQENR